MSTGYVPAWISWSHALTRVETTGDMTDSAVETLRAAANDGSVATRYAATQEQIAPEAWAPPLILIGGFGPLLRGCGRADSYCEIELCHADVARLSPRADAIYGEVTAYQRYWRKRTAERIAVHHAQEAADAAEEWVSYSEAVKMALPVLFRGDWVGLASEQEKVVLQLGAAHHDWSRYSLLHAEREAQIARTERWLLVSGLVETDPDGISRVRAVPLHGALAAERAAAVPPAGAASTFRGQGHAIEFPAAVRLLHERSPGPALSEIAEHLKSAVLGGAVRAWLDGRPIAIGMNPSIIETRHQDVLVLAEDLNHWSARLANWKPQSERPRPTAAELDAWMQQHVTRGTKREYAVKTCHDKTGATFRTAAAAWNRLPDELKLKRGQRIRRTKIEC